MTATTQSDIVFAALEDGPKSSHEIAAVIGLSPDQVAKRIYDLRGHGLVTLAGVDVCTGRRLYAMAGACQEPTPAVSVPAVTPEPKASQWTSGGSVPGLHWRIAQDALDNYLTRLAETDPVLGSLLTLVDALSLNTH